MTIERFYGSAKGRCHVNRHAGLVYAVATAPGANFAEQMRNTLEALENNMKTGGSDKTRIIQATVYPNDMYSGISIWPPLPCSRYEASG